MEKENIKLVRIDFRLIHGQVITMWVKQYQIKSILVIDDYTYKSPILKKILFGAAPEDILLEVESVETAVVRWENGTLPQNNLLILFKNPETAERAFLAGMKFDSLQVGGLGGSSNQKRICRNINMSQEEFRQLKIMYDSGVKIFCQPIPEDLKVPFSRVLSKFK